MLKIGLTGGIGSGKSTVANLFKAKGISLIDADQIAKDVVKKGQPTLQKIAIKFGSTILKSNGELDRDAMRRIVFQDPEALDWLNNCLHPIIRQEINNQVALATSDYVILDIPLLFENKLQHLVNRILVVDVPVETQLQRVINRDNNNEELVMAIIDKQVSRDFRLEHADDIVDNSGSQDQLMAQIDKLHQEYKDLARHV